MAKYGLRDAGASEGGKVAAPKPVDRGFLPVLPERLGMFGRDDPVAASRDQEQAFAGDQRSVRER